MVALPWIFEAAAHQAMSNLDLALDLARQGVHVFPCQPDGAEAKRPYPGVFWRNQSTTDERRIGQWWERWPDAIPGIDLAKIGKMVLDLDGKIGPQQWAEMSEGREVYTPRITTPSGGCHIWFDQDGRKHGNGRGTLPAKPGDHEGIDVRGHGGYVIAPCAVMLDGSRYEPDGGDFLSAPPVPDWLWEILEPARDVRPERPATPRVAPEPAVLGDRKRAYGEAALEAERRRVAECVTGNRNETLNQAAFSLGTLVGAGCLSDGEVRDALLDAAQMCGLVKDDGVRACQATVSSGLKAGRLKPREIPESGPYEIDVGLRAEIAASLVSRNLIETNGVLHDEDGVVVEPVEVDDELPAELTQVPGLLGDLTNWICNTARRPQRGLALGAALTVLGTACGRHLAGPTGSGTHLYVVGLAPTGAGKDHALQQILTALNAAKMSQFIGPSQFISMPAVINFMVRSPLAVCAMDEFGSFMKRINNRRASGFEGAITGILRTAWGASFKPMPTPEWAGKTSETILAPALSIYGVSTAEEFYGALEGGDTSNGVLNRLLVIETRRRPHDVDPKMRSFEVPARISEGLTAVMDRQGIAAAALLSTHDMMPDPYQMPWGPGAEEIYKALVRDVERRCDGDVQAQAFFARTAEMAVRLATIRAAGVNPIRPAVSQADMEWGAKLATWSAMGLARGATDYIADSENQSSANLVRRAIRDAGGRIKHRNLLRKLNHRIKDRDLRDIVRALAEAEQISIEKVIPQGGGTPSVWYSIIAD